MPAHRLTNSCVLVLAALGMIGGISRAGAAERRPLQTTGSVTAQSPTADTPPSPVPQFDKAIFHGTLAADQLTFLNKFAGVASEKAFRDKQYRKLMQGVTPDCIFHYGRDMSIHDALGMVMDGSKQPVQIRDGRYMVVSGRNGPYLLGRAMLWIDLQDGIFLGAFYFHPTNGEPTPTVNVFSTQVTETTLKMSQLPPAFAEDLNNWAMQNSVGRITTRYFITGSNMKIVLEHDEDYCAPTSASPAPRKSVCEQMTADAADIDVNAAYYVELTNHATNATAWMINDRSQVVWAQDRDAACGISPDPLECRIIWARQRVRIILAPRPLPRPY